MNNEYYILEDEEQLGPFSFDELIKRDIDIHTSILSPKASEWQYASELPELYAYFEAKDIYFPTLENLASAGQRTLAFIVDYLLVFTIAWTIILKLGWIILPATMDKFVLPPADVMLKMQSVFYVIYLIYSTGFELTGWKGSIGKKICGLRVVDVNGEKITILQSLGRNVGVVLSVFFSMIPFVSIFGSEYKQEWYDNLAKTYIIKIK